MPQKPTLASEPGLQDYFKEQAAIDKNTARLRELRLAREAEAAKDAPAARTERPARAARKRPLRRGIGST